MILQKQLPGFTDVLIILLLTLMSSPSIAQVYPYGYSPDINQPSKKKYGLVDAKHKKVTEPLYDAITPFENQYYNQFTIYFTLVPDPEAGEGRTKIMKGIINKQGEVVNGVSSANLEYDGNGRIAFEQSYKVFQFYNLKTGKKIIETENITIQEIIRGDVYYLKLYDNTTFVTKVYDDSGKLIPLPYTPYFVLELIETEDGETIFKMRSKTKYNWKYYNAAGEELQKSDFVEEEEMPVFLDMSVDSPDLDRKKNKEDIKKGIADLINGKMPDYEIDKYFENGLGQIKLISIKKGYSYGLVNVKGEIVLPCEYRKINEMYTNFDEDLKNDKFYLQIRGKEGTGVINLNGKMTIPPKFGYLEYRRTSPYFHITSKNGYWGLAQPNGHYFLPEECECYDD